MRVLIIAMSFLMLLTIASCDTNYSVDLKIRNSSSKLIYLTIVQKDNNKKSTVKLNPGESFAISKYDRPGTALEWTTVWKYNIKQVLTADSISTWKDYNVEGAWEQENLSNRTKAVLVISNNDFNN